MNPADLLLNADPHVLPQIAAGTVSGVIILAALAYSPLFRSLALGAAATCLIFIVARDGLQGLMTLTNLIIAHAQAQKALTKGLLIGGILASFAFTNRRSWHNR